MSTNRSFKIALPLLSIIAVFSIIFFTQFHTSAKEISKTENFSEMQIDDLIKKIKSNLFANDYAFSSNYQISSDKTVELTVKLLSGQNIDESTKKDIEQLAVNVLEENNFNPKSFKINIINYFSKSQSYIDQVDDLTAYIGLSLHEKSYIFSIEQNTSSDKMTEILVKLPHEKLNKSSKKQIEQIAVDVIKKNNFDPKLFKINIQSYKNN